MSENLTLRRENPRKRPLRPSPRYRPTHLFTRGDTGNGRKGLFDAGQIVHQALREQRRADLITHFGLQGTYAYELLQQLKTDDPATFAALAASIKPSPCRT